MSLDSVSLTTLSNSNKGVNVRLDQKVKPSLDQEIQNCMMSLLEILPSTIDALETKKTPQTIFRQLKEDLSSIYAALKTLQTIPVVDPEDSCDKENRLEGKFNVRSEASTLDRKLEVVYRQLEHLYRFSSLNSINQKLIKLLKSSQITAKTAYLSLQCDKGVNLLSAQQKSGELLFQNAYSFHTLFTQLKEEIFESEIDLGITEKIRVLFRMRLKLFNKNGKNSSNELIPIQSLEVIFSILPLYSTTLNKIQSHKTLCERVFPLFMELLEAYRDSNSEEIKGVSESLRMLFKEVEALEQMITENIKSIPNKSSKLHAHETLLQSTRLLKRSYNQSTFLRLETYIYQHCLEAIALQQELSKTIISVNNGVLNKDEIFSSVNSLHESMALMMKKIESLLNQQLLEDDSTNIIQFSFLRSNVREVAKILNETWKELMSLDRVKESFSPEKF